MTPYSLHWRNSCWRQRGLANLSKSLKMEEGSMGSRLWPHESVRSYFGMGLVKCVIFMGLEVERE